MSRWLHKKLNLSHHRHSGKLIHHRHTSHGALLLVLVSVGVMMFFATRAVVATAQTLTESGDITVSGTVPGPPPSEPAVILAPKNGDVFKQSLVDVSGTCPAGNNFVEIYKNDIFAGATNCLSGTFALKIDLVIGTNKLTAKVKDNLNQYGPDSAPATVTYQPESPPKGKSPAGDPAHQLIIVPDSQYFGTIAGNRLSLYITVSGGELPYAVTIDWGDKKKEVIPKGEEGRFGITHTYRYGSIYYIKTRAKDNIGNEAYAQTTVVIAGPKLPTPAELITEFPILAVIWPMYVATVGAAATFWLGEKYQSRRMPDLWKNTRRK